MMKVTIDRSKWFRGQGGDKSALLIDRGEHGDPDLGKMCCLGFVALACGLTDADIGDQGDFHQLETYQIEKSKLPRELVVVEEIDDEEGYTRLAVRQRRLVEDIIDVNDDKTLEEVSREIKLEKLFIRANIELEFVDG